MSQKLEIWFSNDYKKLPLKWENSEAVLLSVCETDKNILLNQQEFLKYDTEIRGVQDPEYYPINFQLGIILLFWHKESKQIFTTIRSYSNEKFTYYFDSIGEKFFLRRRY